MRQRIVLCYTMRETIWTVTRPCCTSFMETLALGSRAINCIHVVWLSLHPASATPAAQRAVGPRVPNGVTRDLQQRLTSSVPKACRLRRRRHSPSLWHTSSLRLLRMHCWCAGKRSRSLWYHAAIRLERRPRVPERASGFEGSIVLGVRTTLLGRASSTRRRQPI